VRHFVVAAISIAATILVCLMHRQVPDSPFALLSVAITAILLLISSRYGRSAWLAAWLMFIASMSYGGQLFLANLILMPTVAFLAVDAIYSNWGKIPQRVFILIGIAPLVWVLAFLSGNKMDMNMVMHHIQAYLFAIWISLKREDALEIIAASIFLSLLSAAGILEVAFKYSSRLEGPYGSATAFGATMSAFLATISLWYYCVGERKKAIFAIFIPAFAIMLLTGTRGAVLGLAFAVCAGVFLRPNGERIMKNIMVRTFIMLGIFIVLGFIWSILPDSLTVKQTFGALDVGKKTVDPSSMCRLAAWWVVMKTFPAHPWMGHGIGQFESLFAQHFTFIKLAHAHNIFMATLADLGIVGIVLLLALLVGGVISLFKWSDTRRAMVVFCSGLSIIVIGQFDFIPLYPSCALWGGFFLGWAYKKQG